MGIGTVMVTTSPAGAVEKYCVCLSVCLSVREDSSGNTSAIFTKLFEHVAYVRGSGILMIGHIAYQWEGGGRSAQHG